MFKNQKANSNKAITLIALIITIVILLILAGVGIKVVISGKLIETTENAVNNLNNKVEQQQDKVDELIGELDKAIGSAKDVAKNPSKYYGAVVTNYTCTNNDAVDEWKIFYADEENIYLIAGDYIHCDYIPEGKIRKDANTNGYYTNYDIFEVDDYTFTIDYSIIQTGSDPVSRFYYRCI